MSTPEPKLSLIGALLHAPLVGVLKRWPHRLHAVPIDSISEGWDRGTFRSVCGMRGLRFLAMRLEGTEDEWSAGLWPPYVRGAPDGVERCRECWEATGRMRPRCRWGRRVAA